MSYTHLSASERIQLHQLRTTTDLSLRAIAEEMGRSQSSLSRELRRNQMSEGYYLPDTAHKKMKIRRQEAKSGFCKISESCLQQIKERLEKGDSPEQISGRLKREGQEHISYGTIYRMIYADFFGLGKYRQNLRHSQRKRRPYGSKKSRQAGIPGRVGIEERPDIADQKIEIGHWEGDTIIGANHTGAIVTHVDKASKYLLAGLVKNKTVEQVNKVTIDLFKEIDREKIITFTFDNGKEFSGHKELSQVLGVSCFFANPYHSWERGLNEHTNGLLRQYFPKGTNFRIVKPEELANAVNLINHRPRKSLDYQTPFEVFYRDMSDADALQM